MFAYLIKSIPEGSLDGQISLKFPEYWSLLTSSTSSFKGICSLITSAISHFFLKILAFNRAIYLSFNLNGDELNGCRTTLPKEISEICHRYEE